MTAFIRLTLDRDLPVPLGAQLRGLVDHGIACGQLRPGDRLPSVRDLAEDLGVAPMTVAGVYRDLKASGLIEARAGSGTFVAQRALTDGDHARLAAFHREADALVAAGLALGLRPGDIAGTVAARLSARQNRDRRHVALVGLSPEATADDARALAAALGSLATVDPVTLEALEGDRHARARAAAADLVLTFAHRRREVAALLPDARVEAIGFIPAATTRRALAALDPRARVLAVSRFPAFLPVMRPGVQRFAPHGTAVDAAVMDDPALPARLAGHDVVVYATGAEAVLARLPPGTSAVEYRHGPDPGDVDRIVRPCLAAAAEPPYLPHEKDARC